MRWPAESGICIAVAVAMLCTRWTRALVCVPACRGTHLTSVTARIAAEACRDTLLPQSSEPFLLFRAKIRTPPSVPSHEASDLALPPKNRMYGLYTRKRNAKREANFLHETHFSMSFNRQVPPEFFSQFENDFIGFIRRLAARQKSRDKVTRLKRNS